MSNVNSKANVFNKYEERLKTFHSWSSSKKKPVELAAAGFVYTGIKDYVRCMFCRVIIGNWLEDDVPITVHRRNSPASCPFTTHSNEGKLYENEADAVYDVCGNWPIQRDTRKRGWIMIATLSLFTTIIISLYYIIG